MIQRRPSNVTAPGGAEIFPLGAQGITDVVIEEYPFAIVEPTIHIACEITYAETTTICHADIYSAVPG